MRHIYFSILSWFFRRLQGKVYPSYNEIQIHDGEVLVVTPKVEPKKRCVTIL
jgi:hypothetical protein